MYPWPRTKDGGERKAVEAKSAKSALFDVI